MTQEIAPGAAASRRIPTTRVVLLTVEQLLFDGERVSTVHSFE
jgi:hypothetical protein